MRVDVDEKHSFQWIGSKFSPRNSQSRRCQGCRWIWSFPCLWPSDWSWGWSRRNTGNITPWQQSPGSPLPVTMRGNVCECVGKRQISESVYVCIYVHTGCVYSDLFYSEWGADFLSSEDNGALSQHLRQLEDIQTQQLTGIGDHWKDEQRWFTYQQCIYLRFTLFNYPWTVPWPCLVVIWAPPAVMNSMLPSCKTPDSNLNMSLISSSVNSNTFSASYTK